MSVVLLRTLTLKSKLGVGKYKNETVEKLIGMNMQKNLISVYYKLEKFNFNDEVLEILGITDEWRIEKPKTDRDKYLKFLQHVGYIDSIKSAKAQRNKDLDKMKYKKRPISKSYLQAKNHGR